MNIQNRSLSHRRRILGDTYNDLIMGLPGVIAYWPQDETSGAVARCLTDPAMNGAYTGVTLANDNTGPFGTPAPFYDGTNDFCAIYTAALNAAFNGVTGTAIIWAKVANAGVWTDAAGRYALRLYDDGNNRYEFWKSSTNNAVTLLGNAGAGTASISKTSFSDTGWFTLAATWSDSNNADEFIAYVNAIAIAAPSPNLNAWGGAGLAGNATLIGAKINTPTSPWHGWLGPAIIADQVWPLATIQRASLVA